MLRDLLELAVTPAPLAHRRLGCVGDSVRLVSRSRRCRGAWKPHREATCSVILQAMADTRRRDTVVVLGSGPLDDVPLAELAAGFRRVVLVDAVHPWRALIATRRYRNVERVSADLSGCFGMLLGRETEPVAGLPRLCGEAGTDLVVSVNLLSQLPIRPVDMLERSSRPIGRWLPDQAERLGRAIVEAHLAELRGLAARVCLITDIDEVEEDRNGEIIARQDLLFGASLGESGESWVWELAPIGEVSRRVRLRHRVVAFGDWGGTPRHRQESF